MNTHKIDRALTPDEIREITAECEARDNRSSTPPEKWRAVAEGDGWTLCKIDTLPDMYALLDNVADPLLLYRGDIPDQLGEADAIAAGCGPCKWTDAGEYELVAIVHDDGHADTSVTLYVGKATADGHHDLIASDNSSMWVVGNPDDAERNRDQWDTIAEHCDVAPVIDEVRKIDADLADWLNDRYNEARLALVVLPRDAYDNGDTSQATVVNSSAADIYDAISERWDDIDLDYIVVRGLGDIADLDAVHFADVDDDTRTIDGLAALKADYYAAPYSTEDGDGDCGDWEYYAQGGRRLTSYEAFGEYAPDSIGYRFPPCHNPELRWVPGDYDTLHIESGLTPLADGEETVCEFADVNDFCDGAGDCSPDTILTNAEWDEVLRSMAEA